MKLRIGMRLALWYSLVLIVIVGVLATVFVVGLRAELMRALDSELSARAEQIAVERARDAGPEQIDLTNVPAVAGLTHGEYIIQEIEPSTARVESGNAESADFHFPDTAVQRALRAPARTTLDFAGEKFRFLAVRLNEPGAQAVLVLGKSLEGLQTTIWRFVILVLLSLPIALAAAFGGGRWLSRRALRPIEQITDVAAAINGRDLSARVEIPAVDDEVSRLARTFNAMLGNVENAFESQRRFVADAAHELRTPLAVMRTEIDVTLRGLDAADERRASLESIGDEVDRLIRMSDNMLALARIDEGRLDLLRADVRLDDVASDVVAGMARHAAERGVVLRSRFERAPTTGDRERLRQVAVNLLDNAIRHTPAGRAVEVVTGSTNGSSWLRVADEGPGISENDIARVFARFYRASDTRARSVGGAGLGLSICKAIVEAHHGTIKLDHAAPGTVCTVTLPAA